MWLCRLHLKQRPNVHRCARKDWWALLPDFAASAASVSYSKEALCIPGSTVTCGHVQVYGIASEDMDSLTFATPKLVRNLMKPQTQNLPINEYDYDKVCSCPPLHL